MTTTRAPGARRTEPVALRPARISDLFLLMELADQVGYRLNPEWIRARLGAEPAVEAHVVAALDGVPIGAAHLCLSPRQRPDGTVRARVTALAVDEEHRGEKVGSRLLAHCEELAGRMGAATLEIGVASRRHELDDFWRRHGYERRAPAPFARSLTPGR